MRLAPTVLALVPATAAALLLVACGGQGMAPSAAALTSSAGPAKKAAPTPNPCSNTQQPWDFGGACDTVTIVATGPKTTGGTASAKAYKGYAVQAVFSTGAPAGTVLVVRDATGNGDATGKVDGKTFPAFTYSGIKPLLYIKAHNQSAAFSFSGVPKITVTSAGTFPGSRCYLTKMLTTSDPATNNTWATSPLLLAVPSGHTLAFGTAGFPQAVPKGGTIYIAIGCKS